MSDDANRTLLPTDRASGDAATPALKTWVTPKVITSTMSEDTESVGGAGVDAVSPS